MLCKARASGTDHLCFCSQALKASSIFDKLKGLLPFNTMQVFDLSVSPDTKNLGPNEVGKKELAQLPGADNKYDTATPGTPPLPKPTPTHVCHFSFNADLDKA